MTLLERDREAERLKKCRADELIKLVRGPALRLLLTGAKKYIIESVIRSAIEEILALQGK